MGLEQGCPAPSKFLDHNTEMMITKGRRRTVQDITFADYARTLLGVKPGQASHC